MSDPRDTTDRVPYLESELLRVLIELRDAKPDHYLVRLMTDALNGKLKPVPRTPQHQRQLPFDDSRLPSLLRRQAE